MIAYRSSNTKQGVLLENSKGESVVSNDLPTLLNFLLEPYPNEFRVAWELNEFVAPILRLFGVNQLQELYENRRVWLDETKHSIIYNPRKSFRISRGSYRAKYYHLKQFFPVEEPEPQSLSGVAQKGDMLLAELKGIGIEPDRLSSPVAVIDRLRDEIVYPNYEDLPEEVGQMAWDCCEKHWVEAHKLGWFEKAWDYDIVSSFPGACANLLDLRYGNWVEDKVIPAEALHGFARGVVAVDTALSPIVYTNPQGHLYNPRGKWPTPIMLEDIRFIQEFDIGDFKVDKGYWWVPKEIIKGREREYQPFRELIERLFGYRQKSAFLNFVMKKVLVGVYGSTLQTFGSEGTFAEGFNPVYGALIDTTPKLKVARFILENNLAENVIHISTDGVLLDKNAGIEDSQELGRWRLDSSGSALVVSSGVLFYGDKRPNQLTYPEAMELIKSKPEAMDWTKKKRRMFTMGDALDGGDLGDIGKPMPIVTGFGLKMEHDRDFPELPSSGGELLAGHFDSRPLEVRGKILRRKEANRA